MVLMICVSDTAGDNLLLGGAVRGQGRRDGRKGGRTARVGERVQERGRTSLGIICVVALGMHDRARQRYTVDESSDSHHTETLHPPLHKFSTPSWACIKNHESHSIIYFIPL